MNEPIQITIPDFEDEYSSPIPFGRTAGQAFGAFGAGGMSGGSASGHDSPTISTPVLGSERERIYHHSRQDSIASEDSAHSTRYTSSKPGTPFAHSSQSSIAVATANPSSPFTKKPSFASLRNAFKSGKSADPPPVPQIDHQALPILKNPFNRSTSSLAHTPTPGVRSLVNASPPNARAQTSSSGGSRGWPRTHTYGRSGSTFYSSDTGSDQGHGFPFSPPPIPRVPMGSFGQMSRTETPPPMIDYEDKIVMDPQTPSDYALHAIFIRFATTAEAKIDAFLRRSLDRENLLPEFMGPGVDPKFDEIFSSLGRIAQKNAKPVVDSIMRWRRTQNDSVNDEIILHHSQSRTVRQLETPSILSERKSLASIYIMCRALITVLQSINKDALGEAVGSSLEETTFEQFRKPDLKLLAHSANHRSNAELFASLLGHIANIRFLSVTDRFLAELTPVTSGQVPKDLDSKYESLVKGLKHIQIKVWPNEAFVEGAEFMASLAKAFENAHGLRLKTAFADALIHLLHPIGKSAQDEVNDPQWQQAIEIIFPKARDMANKPRYWPVAYPLMVISLCVAPHRFFLKHWVACLDAGLSKLKEKQHRIPVMNGTMRLIWTYLYRSREAPSTVTSRLDLILRHFFPANRLTVFPHDDHLEALIYIIHYILTRHFEYGRDLCMELLQETQIKAAQGSNVLNLLAPERMTIAIQAILLSLHALERDEQKPAWPSSMDFSSIPMWEDYPTSSDSAPLSLLAKPGMQDFFERFGIVLVAIAVSCSSAVISMSVFDEQWSTFRLNPAYEEAHNYVIRRHPEGSFAYPNQLVPQISMLQTCFQSWPRCLHASLSVGEATDMLLRAIIHIEPGLGEVACGTVRRFMADPRHALIVLSRYTAFLFNAKSVASEGCGTRLVLQHTRLLGLWVNLIDGWVHDLLQRLSSASLPDEEMRLVVARTNEIESGVLFLLSHDSWPIRSAGVKVARILGALVPRLPSQSAANGDTPSRDLRIVDVLHGTGILKDYLQGYDELLDKSSLERLEQWRLSAKADVPLRLADTNDERDRKLWRFVFPAILHCRSESTAQVVTGFREALVAAATRCHPSIALLAGLSTRVPAGLPSRNLQEKDGPRLLNDHKHLVDQWHIWLKILSATAILSETSRPTLTQLGRDHTRAPSDVNFDRERMTTTRGLFRYLTPFLDSEHTIFRDAAVLCISSLPSSSYPQLLEDLSLLAARQFYDETRSKPGLSPSIGRTRRQEQLHSAVARIYYLTAPFLQHQRSAGRQAALANVLKFVRNTQAFLTFPEMRDNYSLQRLRRYFCGTVERLFDGLTALKDSDRFIPSNMHLSLYRLCEEWCQFGAQTEAVTQRLAGMQRACTTAASHSQSASECIERFQHESALLSKAAVGALASLCQKAYFPPEISAGSPVEGSALEFLRPLEASSVLERLNSILSSHDSATQNRGRKALRALLSHGTSNDGLLGETLHRALVTSADLDSGNARFFEVVADVICTVPNHGFSFSQVICLGLSNLCHPLLDIRRHAFNITETIHEQSAGILSMAQFEASVGSLSPSMYLHAHRLISDFLAGEHPLQAAGILSQFSTWLSRIRDGGSWNLLLLLLQTLEYWVSNIDLMTEDKSRLSRDGHTALYHLVALSLRFGHSQSEQVLALWTRLVDSPHQSNGHATVRFLLEQSHKVGSTLFISCAANIVSCLSQTSVGRQVFEDLCSVIEPARMLPTIDHKLAFPDAAEVELWSDLDALFADQPRLSLGAAQYALLFLADVALERQWEAQAQLPVLLHAIFTHIDHRIPFVRQQAQRMLFQLLRSWAPGYDEHPNRSDFPSRISPKSSLADLEKEASHKFWRDDESSVQSEPKMKSLCKEVLKFLEPLAPRLTERWGSLALTWGTACSIRAVAFRSLQIFRALMPHVNKPDLALLLGRLSNTISAPDENIQSFTSEILSTLNALAASQDLDVSLLPQVFWTAFACLSTTVESEFRQVLTFLDSLLKRVDLDDPHISGLLVAHRPSDWMGAVSLQSSLLTGLRSASTSSETLRVLQILAKFTDGRLIDHTEGRLRDLYTTSLPWCLHAMDSDTPDEDLHEFASNIARLAEGEGRESISRIMTSFVKSRFRTKDDFLRQSVASLREHYGADHWKAIVTLLLGLVLNRDRWLQVQSMQMLKVLFQQRDARNPAELGSEHLMPLLRLLETDLASQALEVLDEPMIISGGPPAKHVLRISMNAGTLVRDMDAVADLFGIPEDSGWCVAKANSIRERCRSNVMAVFDTCKMSSRPSLIEFEPEIDILADIAEEDDLGGLVQNLHELTTFFQEGSPKTSAPVPSQQLEARVAAILSKSTTLDAVAGAPQTPYLDVFRVDSMSFSEDSDGSDTDSEHDAFVFDLPPASRNGRSHGYPHF